MTTPRKRMAKKHLQWIPLRLLKVNEVQREKRWAHIKRIAQTFDTDAFGIPVVTGPRTDGMFDVLDGQQRIEALRVMGWDDTQQVECEVLPDKGVSRDAAVFNGRNTTVRVRPIITFLNAVRAGDPMATAITTLVEKHGFRVSEHPGDKNIAATKALERLYKHDPGGLDLTLDLLQRAWHGADDSLQGQVIEGVGMVVIRHREDIDLDALRKRLSEFAGGPSLLLGKGRTLASVHPGWPIADGVAQVVTDIYNSGRRSSRLPNWR